MHNNTGCRQHPNPLRVQELLPINLTVEEALHLAEATNKCYNKYQLNIYMLNHKRTQKQMTGHAHSPIAALPNQALSQLI